MTAADWLVCANCAGRVSEGRCAVCRDRRARMREERGAWGPLGGPGALLMAALLALVAVALLVARPA
ncbi:membrane protein [Streptomyces xiamenensis]|uniref:Membrane protein n=1 Tax=Streptomyces xiamenensis TaxID=408015 RepID=A0A0F7FTR8_9ACTN|nr:hypothetical protein [Streptomyces xiamenensis]AKG43140.1 membrane protein [Streptomyces xiamenensis]